MVQRDYIRRICPSSSRRKKGNNSKKKQSGSSSISLRTIVIAAIILMFTIIGLYSIDQHKKKEPGTFQNNKENKNDLPAKPEEHWRYIKELENRQPRAHASAKFSVSNKKKNLNI